MESDHCWILSMQKLCGIRIFVLEPNLSDWLSFQLAIGKKVGPIIYIVQVPWCVLVHQAKDEFLDKCQDWFNIMIELTEGYGCVLHSEKTLWDTDRIYSVLSDRDKWNVNWIKEVKERWCGPLLAYGFTSCLRDQFDTYKKVPKSSYSQSNNKYNNTVVGAYHMGLDVMQIY